RRQRHVCERRILAGRGRHARAVGNEHVRRVPHLVPFVQHRRTRVATHSGGAHLMDSHTGKVSPFVWFHIARTCRLQHLCHVVFHVEAHQALVFARRTVDLQHGQSPLVCSALVDRHFVVVVRQHLPEGGRSYFPLFLLRHGVLEFASDTQFAYRALPVAATCGALVTETSQVWPLVAEEVAIARDIEAVRPAPVVV